MKRGKSLLKFLTFTFASILNVHTLEYSDLEAIGVACRNRDSCTSPTRHTTFNETNCECDRSCSVYNDCCIDSTYRSSTRGSSSQWSRGTCMPFGNEPNTGAYVVNTCSPDFSGSQEVQRKCQNDDDISDPLLSAPVTDTSLHVTYKNRYCAECNLASPSSLTSWLILLNCESIEYVSDVTNNYIWSNLKYRSDLKQWGVEVNNDTVQFHSCNLIFDMPSYVRKDVRLCRANIVSTCPSKWKRLPVKRACESYLAMVYKTGNDDQAFRNPHCALCNGLSVDALVCDKGLSGKRRKPLSFALLLDINQSDGDQVGVSIQPVPSCPSGQKYDPFFKKCRPLVCALPGHSMVNGRCVRG
ncbi:uncharacterized protein LOC118203920 [Stegodyphus dumicola]|uniref:uncharacterized protein LOC118203920 n=1 Tax=Stegodyphus dumicola TaxID=202533 RepID=UPI0015A9B31B|nr:uncharacterized protein LOC118203920 [Stegodyphus dumicola]